jgi:hypothetical protein
MILRERIRNEIREELAKHQPVETARMALELLAEISIRFVEEDGSARYQVLDQNGRPRTKVVDGKAVDLAIPDLVAELRDKHPMLFPVSAGERRRALKSRPNLGRRSACGSQSGEAVRGGRGENGCHDAARRANAGSERAGGKSGCRSAERRDRGRGRRA